MTKKVLIVIVNSCKGHNLENCLQMWGKMDQNWIRTLVPHWLHHQLLWGMLHASTSSNVQGVAWGWSAQMGPGISDHQVLWLWAIFSCRLDQSMQVC